MTHALGRSIPRLVLHSTLAGHSATITSHEQAGGGDLYGREGVVTAVSGEWEAVELELTTASRGLRTCLGGRSRAGAHAAAWLRQLPAHGDAWRAGDSLRAHGRKVRLLGWAGLRGRWRVQLDRSATTPLGMRHASLLALGWERK
jgi:hypothetical protein